MVFLDMIDDRFVVHTGDPRFDTALITPASPSFVIPAVQSFRLEAQVVEQLSPFRFADQPPREVVIEADLPVPAPLALIVGQPLLQPSFGFFGVPGMLDALAGLPGVSFAPEAALLI